MDERLFGLHVRALRRRRRWRQVDLGSAAGVSQALISLVERGHVDGVTVRTLRAILGALDARLAIEARWRGGLLDRLVDEGHATLVNLVVSILSGLGWETVIEVSFNHYGDRGSIDVLAFQSSYSTLLVVEVKTEITSLEELARRLDVKRRLARTIAADTRGWRAARVGVVVVLPEGTASRGAIARFAAAFDSAYPMRGREVRAWLRQPDRAARGVWFLSSSSRRSAMSGATTAHRVRVPKTGKPRAA
jgi:transcriptional regulator with XRE-family HTH domain